MKKTLFYFVVATIFFVAFVACEKDDIGGNASIIEAKNVDVSECRLWMYGYEEFNPITGEWEWIPGKYYSANIIAVKARLSGYDYDVAESEFKNNSFSLKLSKVPEHYLDFVTSWSRITEDMISDKNAKWQFIRIYIYDDKRNDWRLSLRDIDMYAEYVFVDKNFTIQGVNSGYQYDCSFKKGWNIMYEFNGKYMTKKPSDTNFRWEVY